jgi:predicted transcriptional regulator with HTH domain
MSDAETLRRALCRTDVPRGQITLLKYLYEADGFVSTDELAREIRGGDTHSFISVLGPFSNRVNATDAITGDPGYRAVVETERRDGTTYYRLRDDAREAIDASPALRAAITEHTMGELRDASNPVVAAEAFDVE